LPYGFGCQRNYGIAAGVRWNNRPARSTATIAPRGRAPTPATHRRNPTGNAAVC
jgi:hypothetical protein